MVIYIVYQKFYADFENGEDDALFIECGYKNKRKAVKKAKELMNQAKSSHLYIDEDIRNKRSIGIENDKVFEDYNNVEKTNITNTIISTINKIYKTIGRNAAKNSIYTPSFLLYI